VSNYSGCLLLQLLSVDYPAEVALSAEERILHDAAYYIRFVARSIAASSVDDCDEDDIDQNDDVIDHKDYTDGSKYFINLHKLLTFPSLKDSCADDINILR